MQEKVTAAPGLGFWTKKTPCFLALLAASLLAALLWMMVVNAQGGGSIDASNVRAGLSGCCWPCRAACGGAGLQPHVLKGLWRTWANGPNTFIIAPTPHSTRRGKLCPPGRRRTSNVPSSPSQATTRSSRVTDRHRHRAREGGWVGGAQCSTTRLPWSLDMGSTRPTKTTPTPHPEGSCLPAVRSRPWCRQGGRGDVPRSPLLSAKAPTTTL